MGHNCPLLMGTARCDNPNPARQLRPWSWQGAPTTWGVQGHQEGAPGDPKPTGPRETTNFSPRQVISLPRDSHASPPSRGRQQNPFFPQMARGNPQTRAPPNSTPQARGHIRPGTAPDFKGGALRHLHPTVMQRTPQAKVEGQRTHLGKEPCGDLCPAPLGQGPPSPPLQGLCVPLARKGSMRTVRALSSSGEMVPSVPLSPLPG